MAGGSTTTDSDRSCTYITNGLIFVSCASQFDSPPAFANSFSYFSASDALEQTPLMANFSYIETISLPTTTHTLSKLTTPKNQQMHTPLPILMRSSNSNTTASNTQQNPDTSETTVVTINLSTKKKYKPVALKVRPHIGTLPDKFRILRNIVGDPLKDLPILPTQPPLFTPTG